MGQSPSISETVEKMVQAAPPATAGSEKPGSPAPEQPVRPSEEASQKSPEGDGNDRSAFEQELLESLPEEERKAFETSELKDQQRMMAFMKRHYRQNAKQMTELGTLRKAIETLRSEGVTQEDLVKLIQQKRGLTKPEAQKVLEDSGLKRGYARWKDKAQTPEEREQLAEAEQVQRELVEDVVRSILAKEVAPLREKLDVKERQERSERSKHLEAEINDLEDKLGYPGSLVETYRSQMYRLGLDNTENLSAEDLLVRVAGIGVVKKALLKTQGKSETPPKPSAPRLSSGIVKKTEQEAPARNGRGRASVSKFVNSLLSPVRS